MGSLADRIGTSQERRLTMCEACATMVNHNETDARVDGIDPEPYFSPEAQQVFTVGSRVYVVEKYGAVGEGAEGRYIGHTKFGAFVGFDTPSGDPYQMAVPYAILRNRYS